jgi:hypothetical protein
MYRQLLIDRSAVKHILEKAVEIVEEVKPISEWHRRMTHEELNQKGQHYNMGHFVEGAKVYFYRPSSVLDVEKKTRKAMHVDYYVGPATIVKKIGSHSFQISFFNPTTGTTQLLQRDAGTIILKWQWQTPSSDPLQTRLAPTKHQQKGVKLKVGEIAIMMDYPDAKG